MITKIHFAFNLFTFNVFSLVFSFGFMGLRTATSWLQLFTRTKSVEPSKWWVNYYSDTWTHCNHTYYEAPQNNVFDMDSRAFSLAQRMNCIDTRYKCFSDLKTNYVSIAYITWIRGNFRWMKESKNQFFFDEDNIVFRISAPLCPDS